MTTPNNGPLADWLTVSTPEGDSLGLAESVSAAFEVAGGSRYVSDDQRYYGGWCVEDGHARWYRKGQVAVLSVSGGMLRRLRLTDTWLHLLHGIAEHPHRVTRLDVALDVHGESFEGYAASILAKVQTGQLRFTRKAVGTAAVKVLQDGGGATQTVYLGARTAEVYACLYDKAAERLAAGVPYEGDWYRVELRLAKVGATLRDAYEPEQVFYHFAAPGLVTRPVEVAEWVPYAEGYTMPDVRELTAYERLVAAVELSPAIFDVLRQAQKLPDGLDTVTRLLQRRYSAIERSLGAEPGRALGARLYSINGGKGSG